MPTVPELLATGGRALARGEWQAAKDAFRDALAAGDSPEALVGLADAGWWLGEVSDAIGYRERAYAAYQQRDDPLGAAAVAWQLSLDYWDNLGNTAAGQGWLDRTRRLADEHGLAPVRGWVLLLDAYYTTDPHERERFAARAGELARAADDAALRLCALSQLGAALVDQGRVAEGVRLLDESMAGALAGEGGRPEPVVFTSCTTLQACVACADFERAVQWLRASDRFSDRFGGPYLRANCRIHHASMLLAIGDWTAAEEELQAALALSAGTLPVLHEEALAGLASLRLAQGRIEEAARLVDGVGGRPAATVLGRVYLWQGRPESACSVLRRGLATHGPDRLQTVLLRELLGEALVACGEHEAAREHSTVLLEWGAAQNCTVATAYGERLGGRVLAATGEETGARDLLDRALTAFVGLRMPYEQARTRLLLADSLRSRSPQAATDEARTALAALDGLGARHEADAAAALLRELGATPARAGPRGAAELTRREQEVLALLGEGLSNPEIAERLYLSRKTVEHHVARVLSKLGLRSRSAAAAEAVRRR